MKESLGNDLWNCCLGFNNMRRLISIIYNNGEAVNYEYYDRPDVMEYHIGLQMKDDSLKHVCFDSIDGSHCISKDDIWYITNQ